MRFCFLFALFFPLGLPAAESVPAFSIESVLRSLAKSYPQANRPSEAPATPLRAHENMPFQNGEDGHSLALDLYRPDSADLLPAVLVIHGGGWVAGDRTMERPLARHLAARGFVVATVSYRLGPAGRFPAAVQDLRAAIRWLRKHAPSFGIDPDRIAAVGGSAGGTLAVSLGTMHTGALASLPHDNEEPSASVQAVVDIDGTVTFLDNRLIEQSLAKQSPYWEYVHGPYDRNPSIWAAASPLNLVSRQTSPTLFLCSSAVTPILAGREEMHERLRILGVDSEFVRFPDSPHTFWLVQPWFDDVINHLDRFLSKHLKPRAP